MAYCSECTYLKLSSKDIYGKFWCEKKLEWHLANEIECYRFCKDYNRDHSVANCAYQYSVEHSRNSSCYLTTMLCSILKMNDNNPFLSTMRNFRNNYLSKNEKYKPILVEYDIIGPEIAKNLNNDTLKYQIAANMFFKYIKPITKLIKSEKNEEAINQYINMTNTLKSFYNLSITDISKIQIDAADLNNSGHGIYKVKKITSN